MRRSSFCCVTQLLMLSLVRVFVLYRANDGGVIRKNRGVVETENLFVDRWGNDMVK